MRYDARCKQHGIVEIVKRMDEPLPRCPRCGWRLARVYDAPPVHFNAAGFYASDVTRFKSQIGSERFARFEAQRASAERRAKAGQLTAYERALEQKDPVH